MLDGTSISFNRGFEWSIFNVGSSTCNLSSATNHSIWGNLSINPGTSARYFTKTPTANIAVSYRIA